MSGSTQLLSHCYALATEGQLATALKAKLSIDTIMSPLLIDATKRDDASAALAQRAIAAQANFIAEQSRMTIGLQELPADLFRRAISLATAAVADGTDIDHDVASASLREQFDEANGRLAVLARLVTALRDQGSAAFNIGEAGLALFASTLALSTGQARELAILACVPGQHTRLGIMLKASGLANEEINRIMSQVHSQVELPPAFAELEAQDALALLGAAHPRGAVPRVDGMSDNETTLAARGITDDVGRLLSADAPLAELQQSCGGTLPGVLAIPELLDIVQQCRNLNLRLSREFEAYDGKAHITGLVKARPVDDEDHYGCEILVENWQRSSVQPENQRTAGERQDAIDRSISELVARLDAQQRIVALDTHACDLAELRKAVKERPGKPWSDYVKLDGVTHRPTSPLENIGRRETDGRGVSA